MNKKVYITDEERKKCRRVIEAFAELYEETEDDIIVLDGGTYGFVKMQYYDYPYGFNTVITFTDSRALFDDLWEDWLNMQLLNFTKDSFMSALDYEDIFKSLPKDIQETLMSKKVYFAEKTGVEDILLLLADS